MIGRRAASIGVCAVLVASAACGRPEADGTPPQSPDSSAPTAATAPPGSERSSMRADPDDLLQIADRYRQACGSPGAAVGLRYGDGPDQIAISGSSAPGVPLVEDSQFLAGSVTKLFVAAVALQVIANGDLSADDTVDRFLPDWPRGDRITVADLLSHRSGMGDFGNDFSAELRDLVLADLNRVYRYDEVLDLVAMIPPVDEPGAGYHYTNANTIVLGAIVQRVTGQTLGELIRVRVTEPLALHRTFYGPDDLAAAEAVDFHGLYDIVGDGNPIDIGGLPRAAALTVDPAGAGLFATVPDLLTATHALFATDELLAAPERAQLAAQVSTLTATDLLLDERFTIHGHGGASPGAQTIVAYDESHNVTVAVWCNRLDPGEYELLPSVAAAHDALELAAAGG
jgi:D-alanyl-D-alanine carboxypeptidase